MISPSHAKAVFLANCDARASLTAVRPRLSFAALGFALAFCAIALRLVLLGFVPSDGATASLSRHLNTTLQRPDIVDRRGRILATDIQTASLYADPKRIVDLDDTVDQLASVLPGLDPRALRKRLAQSGRFAWVRREMTPKEQAIVHELGLAGLDFVTEHHRVYPAGASAAHVLGYVDVDNRGLAGIENYIDRTALMLNAAGEPQRDERSAVQLSVDLGVQHALRSELSNALDHYKAKAAAGIVLNIHSGEVLAMTSLPDFDPNRRDQALEKTRYDRLQRRALRAWLGLQSLHDRSGPRSRGWCRSNKAMTPRRRSEWRGIRSATITPRSVGSRYRRYSSTLRISARPKWRSTSAPID